MKVGGFQPVRGTKDLLSEEYYKLFHIQNVAQEIGERFGFMPVQTPIFEFQEVFCKTLGDSTDVIGKEMYTFADRGGDVLALRPEFTAAIVRLLLSEKMQPPARLFTAGPVFRYERPQKCRQRQFHQINYECFGAGGSQADAEIISLAYCVLEVFGLHCDVTLEINSLGSSECMNAYRASLLSFFEKYRSELSEDSRRRLQTNPLRILDSKDATDKEILSTAPSIEDFYDAETRASFEGLKDHLTNLGIPYAVNRRLVRGLDYYTGTVFEYKTSSLGAQDAIIAGGRYDNLVAAMGGENVPAIGFAGGVERLAALMSYSRTRKFCVFILPISEEVVSHAMRITYEIRRTLSGVQVICDIVTRLKTGIKRADRQKADIALILGDEEVNRNAVSCKNMLTGKQEEISISNITEYLKAMMAERQ
ncbi:histidine--tRNA ligase [Anaplasma phagocytophilum]|uniref:Histidine--tRNA ligase n=2 Tax=Anaplasma phagocytophilum TaxID=948 RepID=SYH_ANAPZ|nr:histidine--tRNA ligase [Anaplasma phagocytophilum]Q2GLK4.1 RecName: Full=Histidine--tRNA ligase; AltName: Full=Histidyl-tRNA synthetase; Short=HisRS [Anaplasma phagocytophilum str. HZ]KJZ98802.1 histidine--tRNA ligase [Anaplasma phagocytophilum str. CR1007]ABD44457.1 histidyl-tRNA synthetase [Anaplasma phagocytophilum str. HZ]AGR78612.1 histidyl-tRNA synthetase [Anaplasma phagocytophilum str. HZ2]AGR79859.1 histidyl-tRNA synthetase [Anaplasma phagocytophilum str. JM]AGR81115.1 histidyl-tRN